MTQNTTRKKRNYGEGSIYFAEANNKWVAKYKPEGWSKPKIFYATTETEVRRKLKQFKKESSKQTLIEIQKMPVKEYMDDWLTKVKTLELKPKSYDRLEDTLKNQIYPTLGDIQIHALTPDDIQGLIKHLLDEGYSYSTIKKTYEAFDGCFKLGVEKGDLSGNPATGVKLPTKIKISKKARSKKIRFFSDEEVKAIYNECLIEYKHGKRGYRLSQALIILLYTGIRIGELLGLKWEHVDFDNKTIEIVESVVLVRARKDEKTKYILHEQDDTKTEAGDGRVIPLNKKAMAALQQLHDINGKWDYVAANTNGTVVRPRNFDRMIRNILKKCEIEPCGAHVFRHTFASMLFKKGIDVKYVSELLGHASIEITYDTYIHLIEAQKKQIIAILDEL